MKSEDILDAVGMIENDAIAAARTYKRAKAHFPRVALIAACLCVALLGTAVAAEMVWGVFSVGRRAEGHNEIIEFKTTGMTCFELDEILDEIAVLAKETGTTFSGRTNVAAFDSWEDAATFIGVPLATSAALEQCPHTETLVGPTVDEDGVPITLYVNTRYQMKGTLVYVDAYLRTEYAEAESRYNLGFSYDPTTTTLVEDTLLLEDGSSAVLFTVCDENTASYHGTFLVDGVFYWIYAESSNGADPAVEQLLHDVLAEFAVQE